MIPTRLNNKLFISILNTDGKRYFTLSYANGPGVLANIKDGERVDPTSLNWSDKNFQYPGIVPVVDETHGGDDVGVFAKGL